MVKNIYRKYLDTVGKFGVNLPLCVYREVCVSTRNSFKDDISTPSMSRYRKVKDDYKGVSKDDRFSQDNIKYQEH